MEYTSLSDALISLIPTCGPWIIFGIVALESAGVPLPGETILVAAALLAATTGQINIVVVVLAAATGAIVGDGMGYMVGRRFGLPFLRRYGRYIRLDEDRLLIGRYLFFQYGNAVVFFGRFIAVLRMFAALLAGANSMPAGRFFLLKINRNLQDFRRAERDLTGPVYCGRISALDFRSTKRSRAAPSSRGSSVRLFERMSHFM
jgi:membrane protein DedA with SNARE-associated domain